MIVLRTLKGVSDIDDATTADPGVPAEPVIESAIGPEPVVASGSEVPVATADTAAVEPDVIGESLPAEPVVAEPVVAEPLVAAEGGPAVETEEPAVAREPVVSASAPEAKKRPSVPLPPPPGRRPASGSTDEPAGKNADAGKILGGIATAITQDEVELVLQDGRLAVIHRRNYAATDTTDLTTVVTQGDRIEGAVLARDDPRQRVVLSRAWGLERRAWERLAAAAEGNEVLKCPVTSVGKKGLVVDVEGIRGFVPLSHVALEHGTDLASFQGQTIELKIIEIDPQPRKRRLVLSRRSLLLREQRRETHNALAALEVGSVRSGVVSSLSDYGAFVDLGGVQGLVHVSELSWSRVNHPREVVSVGDQIDVKILEIKVKKRRVRLSVREVGDDPFELVEVGSILTGPVSRLVDFGAFVDVGGVDGLVHLSEMAEYRVMAPEELVTPGEQVMVKVLSIDKKRRRIELSIRQAVSDQYG
jgi:small subunit ribosomal protein S1